MTDKVSILSIMENPEKILIELALTLHTEELKDYDNIKTIFRVLLEDTKKYYTSLSFIKLIIKIEKEEEVEYVSMNLVDVIEELNKEEKTNFSLGLNSCITERLPLLTEILGEINGNTRDSSSSVRTIGNSSSNSRRDSGYSYGSQISPIRTPTAVKDADMIESHWQYISNVMVLAAGDETAEYSLETVEFMYKTAFEHGLKHARQLNR